MFRKHFQHRIALVGEVVF